MTLLEIFKIEREVAENPPLPGLTVKRMPIFLVKCLRIFKASIPWSSAHLFSKPVGSGLSFGEPAIRFHLIRIIRCRTSAAAGRDIWSSSG
jgi:hypothetical protein